MVEEVVLVEVEDMVDDVEIGDEMDVDVVIDGKVDDTDDVDTEVENEVDFEKLADDDMKVVVDVEKSIDVLTVDKVFVSVIVEEVGTFLKINIIHPNKFF